MTSSAGLRRDLVTLLEKSGAIRSTHVRDAFLKVPRELFVAEFAKEEGLEALYKDVAVITKRDSVGVPISSSSQPQIMALMLENLDLQPGQRVLEIGTGTGYNTALIKNIVGPRGKVVSVDIDPDVASRARGALKKGGFRARVVAQDGTKPISDRSSFDRIIVTASSSTVPRAWFRQLIIGGLVELPFRFSEEVFSPQTAAVLEKTSKGLESRQLIPAGFMGIRSSETDPSPGQGHVLRVHLRKDGVDQDLAQLGGANISKLTPNLRVRLLSLLFDEKKRRVRRLGLRAPWWRSVDVFALLGAPPGFLVGGWGSIGILRTRPLGIALFSGTRRGIDRIHGYGDRRAEKQLLGIAQEWQRRKRPELDNLLMKVRYRNSGTKAWRTVSRGDGLISFDWIQKQSFSRS